MTRPPLGETFLRFLKAPPQFQLEFLPMEDAERYVVFLREGEPTLPSGLRMVLIAGADSLWDEDFQTRVAGRDQDSLLQLYSLIFCLTEYCDHVVDDLRRELSIDASMGPGADWRAGLWLLLRSLATRALADVGLGAGPPDLTFEESFLHPSVAVRVNPEKPGEL